MINILRMDFHRFKKNKIMLLLLLIFCSFQLFAVFMMRQYQQPYEETGILIASMNESEFFQYTLSQPPSWMLLYIAVFSVYFYMSELNSGFYKNYISMRNARVTSVISKMIILALFTLLMFIAAVGSNWIGRQIFFGQAGVGDWGYFGKLLIGQFLLHWAFSILMLYISMITKSLLGGLIAGLILALNVVGMALSALESLFDSDRISSYWLVNWIVSIKDFHNVGDVIQTIAVAVGFIAVCSYAAVRYKKKEDLR